MESIDKIKRRIEKQYNQKRISLWRTLSLLCMIFSMIMGFLIYAKKDENANFLKEHFNVEASFTNMNQNISSFLNSIFNFDIFKSSTGGDQMVDATVSYINEGNNLYSSEGNQVSMLKNGTILFTSSDNDGKIIITSYDNGVVATYFMLSSLEVKVYDYLKQGDIIGTYEGQFKVLFSKDNKLISYEEALL